jgi:hypothetical protein
VQKNRRKNYVPLPALQIQLVLICLFFAACTGMLQALLIQRFVTELLQQLPEASALARADASVWVLSQFFLSLAIMFPVVLGLGILITFRFAGPLVNIEKHLRRVAAGEDPGPCRLRKGDQYQSIADAVNLAVTTLRKGCPKCALAEEHAPATTTSAAPTSP